MVRKVTTSFSVAFKPERVYKTIWTTYQWYYMTHIGVVYLQPHRYQKKQSSSSTITTACNEGHKFNTFTLYSQYILRSTSSYFLLPVPRPLKLRPLAVTDAEILYSPIKNTSFAVHLIQVIGEKGAQDIDVLQVFVIQFTEFSISVRYPLLWVEFGLLPTRPSLPPH